jgi:hypothetical protein
MDTDSVEQQINNLRGVRPYIIPCLCIGVLEFLSLNLRVEIWDEPQFWDFNIFLTLVPVCAGLVWLINIWINKTAIIKAYDTLTFSIGEVSLTEESDGEDIYYFARVREQNHPDWRFQFNSIYWCMKGIGNTYAARIWRGDNGSPVLVATETGILYMPCRSPQITQTITQTPDIGKTKSWADIYEG